MIYTRYEIDSKGITWGDACGGCFVSADGIVLTAAHQIPTTHPVHFVYRDDDGSEYFTTATLMKSDPNLDLALLAPVQSITPAKYLRPDLESLPAPGQSVAILSFSIRRDSPIPYRLSSITPTTVFGVIRGGRFGMNVKGYHGLSGSPVVDMRTGRLVGIVVARKGRGESAYGFRYAIAQSTAFARRFLSGLPKTGRK